MATVIRASVRSFASPSLSLSPSTHVLLFVASAEKALRGTIVEASPEELRVTHRLLLGSRTRRIPARELEELTLAIPAGGVGAPAVPGMTGPIVLLARSDRTSVAFGSGLSRPELEWMRAVIWNVVTA